MGTRRNGGTIQQTRLHYGSLRIRRQTVCRSKTIAVRHITVSMGGIDRENCVCANRWGDSSMIRGSGETLLARVQRDRWTCKWCRRWRDGQLAIGGDGHRETSCERLPAERHVRFLKSTDHFRRHLPPRRPDVKIREASPGDRRRAFAFSAVISSPEAVPLCIFS